MSFGSTLSGATSGAGMGASIGSLVPGVGTAIGAGVGAVAGGIGGALSQKAKFEAEQKKRLKGDMAAMDRGQLGLSEAEKQQAVRQAMGLSGQQIGQAQTQAARDSLSSTGVRDLGQYAKATQAIGAQAANAGAQASYQADEASRQQAEARRQEIMARLDQQSGIESTQNKEHSAELQNATAQAAGFAEQIPKWFPDLFKNLQGGEGGGGAAPAAPAPEAESDAARQAREAATPEKFYQPNAAGHTVEEAQRAADEEAARLRAGAR